jgi:hypothetical protein
MKLCKFQIHMKVIIIGTNFLSNVVINQDCNLIPSWELETFANYLDLGLNIYMQLALYELYYNT